MRKQQSWLLPTLLVLGAGTTAVAWVGTSARPDKSAAPTSLNAGKRDAAMTPDSEPSIANEAPGADLVVDSEPAPVDMQASAIDEVDAHNRSGQIIDDYLRRAEQSLQAYRLTTPAADSAYYYYSEILKRVPDHPAARQGFVRIGDSYAALGERALQRSAYAEAKNYLDRGLSVDPGNLRLRALRSRSTPSKDLSHRVQERLKAWF
jgi:hypothetical protein